MRSGLPGGLGRRPALLAQAGHGLCASDRHARARRRQPAVLASLRSSGSPPHHAARQSLSQLARLCPARRAVSQRQRRLRAAVLLRARRIPPAAGAVPLVARGPSPASACRARPRARAPRRRRRLERPFPPRLSLNAPLPAPRSDGLPLRRVTPQVRHSVVHLRSEGLGDPVRKHVVLDKRVVHEAAQRRRVAPRLHRDEGRLALLPARNVVVHRHGPGKRRGVLLGLVVVVVVVVVVRVESVRAGQSQLVKCPRLRVHVREVVLESLLRAKPLALGLLLLLLVLGVVVGKVRPQDRHGQREHEDADESQQPGDEAAQRRRRHLVSVA
mmetsp:Transcript_4658/g.19848  ORF Transcript_4658/g.19848 Transcript_4658/m.19848 type:complete len:328 (-) Transcript_4658:292-1275(-)